MCGGGCSDKAVDFTSERIDFSTNGTATDIINFAGCRGVEIRNIGTATLRVDGTIEIEPDSSRGFCPPGGGHFYRDKPITFDTKTGSTRILEIVYYREVEEDCPTIND